MSCTCGNCGTKGADVEGLLREILAEMREMNGKVGVNPRGASDLSAANYEAARGYANSREFADKIRRATADNIRRSTITGIAGETGPEKCHPLRQYTPGRPDDLESYGEAK